MSQPQVINTLSDKKREIEAHIGSLERELEQARRVCRQGLRHIPSVGALDEIAPTDKQC